MKITPDSAIGAETQSKAVSSFKKPAITMRQLMILYTFVRLYHHYWYSVWKRHNVERKEWVRCRFGLIIGIKHHVFPCLPFDAFAWWILLSILHDCVLCSWFLFSVVFRSSGTWWWIKAYSRCYNIATESLII